MSRDSNIIDAEVISVDWDDDEPKIKARNVSPGKQTLVATAQRHLDNLSPARKAALSGILKKAGIVGMATYAASLITKPVTDQFAGEGDHHWACKPPEHGRTSYYPVTGNGNYDDNAQVDKLDSLTADLNESTFGYDSEDVRSFHDYSCVEGCVHTVTEPSTLTADVADKYFSDVHDAFGDTISDLNRSAEEPWVQALIQQRYNTLSDRQDEVQTISTACGKMLGSTNTAATEAHSLLRTTIKKTRADLAHGYANGQSGFSWTATAAGATAGLKKGVIGAGIGAVGAGLVSGLWGDHFPDDIKEALETRLDDAVSKAKDALRENDDDVEMFNAVVSDFGGETRSGESVIERAKDAVGDLWDKVTGILPDHIPGVGDLNPLGTPSDSTPVSPLGTTPNTDTPVSPLGKDSPSVTSPGAQTPSVATPTSPLGNVQNPLGSMGSSPLGSMPATTPTTPMSSMSPAAFDQLMGNEPDTAAPELFDGTEVPTDDTTDPLGDDSSGDSGDTDTDTDTDKSDDITDPETVSEDDTKDESDGEVVTDDAAPVQDGDAPAEPTDEQKRTVELPDGRQVTFPSEAHAELVKAMLNSNSENPETVYAAADKAGFQLPPMGSDIGTSVPPMDVQPGDVVKGTDGTGVAIGNGEVLMESGEIRPVEDVAKVDEAGHGIFRLETAEAPAPAPGAAPVVPPPAPAAEQPPAPVTEQVQPPAPVVGEQQPAAPEVTGDPLDLLAAV